MYFQINMATENFGKPLAMRFGMRHEETEVDSQALAPNYTGINWVGGNELTAIQGGGDFTRLQGEYDYTLPNLDLRWDLTEDLVGRMSFSKTLSRPGYGDIQGGITINSLVRVDGGTGSRGNPGHFPMNLPTTTSRWSITTVMEATCRRAISSKTLRTSLVRRL